MALGKTPAARADDGEASSYEGVQYTARGINRVGLVLRVPQDYLPISMPTG